MKLQYLTADLKLVEVTSQLLVMAITGMTYRPVLPLIQQYLLTATL